MSTGALLNRTRRVCLFSLSLRMFAWDTHLGIKQFCEGRRGFSYGLQAGGVTMSVNLGASTAFLNICRDLFPDLRMTKV